jgi:RNA polymerase sigma factor (TIGR02999 family)
MGRDPANPAETPSDPAGSGRSRPTDACFERLYDELHALAASFFRQERAGHTLQPTALVHEAFLRLARQTADWADPVRFRALAAQVMRHVLVDHAAARNAVKRGGGRTPLTLDANAVMAGANDLDIEELDRALKRLAAYDERKARVVELRFFGGLTAEEAAVAMDVSLSTVESDWRMAKAWLRRELTR